MKKIYLMIAICIAFVSASSAQCIPDTSITHNVPGIYPDTLIGLPHSYVGVPYQADIQVKVFTNTTYMGVPATIDSIIVISVAGLPQVLFTLVRLLTVCFPEVRTLVFY
ncbi:MAG: hypothetical protein IPP27_10130 [Bacteroidetes bacterium]|nr:hypothetical protein [Bacteroidota bacterium]